MIYVTIETDAGTYVVRKPMGRIGSLHFGILTKYMPSNKKGDESMLSPMEQERIGTAFEEWSQKILPNILVSFKAKDEPEAKPITLDELTGEEQFFIFAALTSLVKVGDNSFRVVS